jgi:hypothetical protein
LGGASSAGSVNIHAPDARLGELDNVVEVPQHFARKLDMPNAIGREDMGMNTRTRVLGIFLIVAVVALTFIWINASGTVRSVPDQTNDEMEVAPS